MSNEITMPKLSDTMEEGKILRWLKRAGDTVHHGEALAEVETDKADMVLEAFEDGVLQEIKLQEGESAPVGAVIALLGKAGETRVAASTAASPPQSTPPSEPGTAKPEPQAASKRPVVMEVKRQPAAKPEAKAESHLAKRAAEAARPDSAEEQSAAPASGATKIERIAPRPPARIEVHPALGAHLSAAPTAMPRPPERTDVEEHVIDLAGAGEAGKHKASPLARRAAEEAGVDLGQVRGTGPDGRITKRDIDNFLREQQLFRQRRIVAPRGGEPGSHEELSKMRKTIAQRMAASKREIPHFYVTIEIDMEESVKFKKSLETTEIFDEDITFNDIIIKASALALSRYPRINASYENDGIAIFPDINIGMAVAVEDGLIVPVIHNCQRLSLPEIARAAHRLVAKAAQGGFSSEELSGGTFTISNMGMLGVEHFAAVINPPQAAILAVSAIKDRPVVRDGQIVAGKTMMMTVSCDHRIIDGVVAGRFLQEIKRFLENPASLLV